GFRVPANSTDPYDLSSSPANWDMLSCICNLSPTPVIFNAAGVLTFYQTLTANTAAPGNFANNGTPLGGGLNHLLIPYDPNDPNRYVLASDTVRNLRHIAPVFSYAEYLWSTVWLQPVVLNTTQMNTTDTLDNMATTDWILQSEPTIAGSAWPKLNSG